MNVAIATAGHNNPPSELDLLREEFDLSEAENWLDGQPVENDDQMKAVDTVLGIVKAAEKAAKDRKEIEFRPHKEAADAVSERWKPVFDDLGRMRTGLVSLVDSYKRRKAAEIEAERREKEAEAERLKREAEAVARDTDMGDLEQRRKADEIAMEARQADRAAHAVEDVKGMRTRTVGVIEDQKACLHWIIRNDREAVVAFIADYVSKKTREGVRGIDGVDVRREKYAV